MTVNSKVAAIRNGRGEVTGYLRLYWAPTLQSYVSIPGTVIACGVCFDGECVTPEVRCDRCKRENQI